MPPWKKDSQDSATAKPREVDTPHSSARRARSGFSAPMFWATKAERDCI